MIECLKWNGNFESLELFRHFNLFAVYNEEDDHSYSHHEVLLAAFPLALEWLDYDPEQPDQKGRCGFLLSVVLQIEFLWLELIHNVCVVVPRVGTSCVDLSARVCGV